MGIILLHAGLFAVGWLELLRDVDVLVQFHVLNTVMGANKHTLVERFNFPTGSNLIEISTESNPWDSTTFLARHAARYGLNFWTVDVSPPLIEQAARLGCHAVCAHGQDFLINFGEPIVFAYLDNADLVKGGLELPQNRLSAAVHLLQARRLMQWMTDGVIVLDDTYAQHGKGMLAVPFLKECGFAELERGTNYVLLARGYV